MLGEYKPIAELKAHLLQGHRMPMLTIYDRPIDASESVVVRIFDIPPRDADAPLGSLLVSPAGFTADTLEQARDHVEREFPHLVFVPPAASDEPQIVGVYL